MKGHLDADVLAEYRAELITGRRRRAIAAHLLACAECAALDARLAQVSALLAATPVPAVPDALARRLETVLAAEKPISSERHPVPARHRRFPSWGDVFRVRVLAPAAAVAALAGGGYALSQAGDGPSASSGGSTAAGGAYSGAAASNGRGQSAAGAASKGAHSSLSPNRDAKQAGGVSVVVSGVDFRPATLRTQVAGQLRASSTLHPSLATAREAACVRRLSNGATPALAETATYEGQPATVVVIAQPGVDQVLVAGQNCSATVSDILDHAVLSPGISTP